jgi:hypothetical protein
MVRWNHGSIRLGGQAKSNCSSNSIQCQQPNARPQPEGVAPRNLQQFGRTDKLFAAANAVLAKEKPTAWTLKAFKLDFRLA